MDSGGLRLLQKRGAMSILINRETSIIVQGITGRAGEYYSRLMYQFGMNIVAGVSPNVGGSWVLDGKVPVFDSVANAVEIFPNVKAAILFVPAPQALDALYEAADAGCFSVVVCVTKGIPLHDVSKACRYMDSKGIRFIGPNSPGIYNPGNALLGVFPADCAVPGNVGVITRSGTLGFAVLETLKAAGIGVSTCIGIGGDTLQGTTIVDALALMDEDVYTKKIVLIGGVGGLEEERAASYAMFSMATPVVGVLAGRNFPKNRSFGTSGAFIDGDIGSVDKKELTFQQLGLRCVSKLRDLPRVLETYS